MEPKALVLLTPHSPRTMFLGMSIEVVFVFSRGLLLRNLSPYIKPLSDNTIVLEGGEKIPVSEQICLYSFHVSRKRNKKNDHKRKQACPIADPGKDLSCFLWPVFLCLGFLFHHMC